MSRILLLEDDPLVSQLVSDWLTDENHVIDAVSGGADALELFRQHSYDLLILDWEVPEVSGLEIMLSLRKDGNSVPILMLTGRTRIEDKEAGFGSGADDYLTKPFELRELSLRLKALLRRPGVLQSKILTAGDLTLDPDQRLATYKGVPCTLLPREYAVLELFMRNPEHVLSVEAIQDKLWSFDKDVSVSAVRVAITRLRKKIGGEDAPLRTMHGHGYKLDKA